MSLKDIYTCSYYKKLRPKFAFAAAFPVPGLLASGRHTSRLFQRSPACMRLQPWVASVSFLLFSSPLLCENRWNTVKTVGNDGNTFESYEQTGQELDLLQINYDTTGTFDICDAILVRFRHLSWRTWPSVMQHTARWGKDLPINVRFNLVVLCHPHHNGKHKQTPIFIYPPLVSNLGVWLSGRNRPWTGQLSITRHTLTHIPHLKIQSWMWAVGVLRVLHRPCCWHHKNVCVFITIVLKIRSSC